MEKKDIIYKDIKFMYTNADCLSNKMSKLRTRISLDPPDIIAICETWLQDDPVSPRFYPSECLNLQGYNMYRYDNSIALKGGILLYIKPIYDGGPCKKMNNFAKIFEESAWHKIQLKFCVDYTLYIELFYCLLLMYSLSYLLSHPLWCD